jgi:hypothetical protein
MTTYIVLNKKKKNAGPIKDLWASQPTRDRQGRVYMRRRFFKGWLHGVMRQVEEEIRENPRLGQQLRNVCYWWFSSVTRKRYAFISLVVFFFRYPQSTRNWGFLILLFGKIGMMYSVESPQKLFLRQQKGTPNHTIKNACTDVF